MKDLTSTHFEADDDSNPECPAIARVWNWREDGEIYRMGCNRFPGHEGDHFFWLTKDPADNSSHDKQDNEPSKSSSIPVCCWRHQKPLGECEECMAMIRDNSSQTEES